MEIIVQLGESQGLRYLCCRLCGGGAGAARSDAGAVSALLQKFIASVGDNTYADLGFPKQTYGVSKAGEIQLTRLFTGSNEP